MTSRLFNKASRNPISLYLPKIIYNTYVSCILLHMHIIIYDDIIYQSYRLSNIYVYSRCFKIIIE